MDYAQYTLDELYDAQRHINQQQFPENYASLLREIAKRESVSVGTPDEPTVPPKLTTITRVFDFLAIPLACLGLYWGSGALIMIGYAWPTPGLRKDFDPWFSLFLGCLGLLVASLCFLPIISLFKRKTAQSHSS